MGTLAVVAVLVLAGLLALWLGSRQERHAQPLTTETLMPTTVTFKPVHLTADDMREMGWAPMHDGSGTWSKTLTD